MNEESLNSLLLETWRDLHRPQIFWQWLIFAGCLALAWLISWGVRHALERRATSYVARNPSRNAALLERRYSGLAKLFTPLFTWALLLGAGRVLLFYRQPAHLIRVFAIIAIAFVAIYLGLYALRRVFKAGPGLMIVERWFGLLAWLVVALHVLGFLPDVIAALSGPEATFTIGKNLSLSVWQVLSAAFWVAITLVAALWAGATLETRLMSTNSIDVSMRIVLARLGKAVLIVVAVLVAMRLVDIDLTVLSVFGGALGVGLGLGLQRIASNYVSGFIILLDRSLRIGDLITVDKYNGSVTQIRTRCTVVRSPTGVESLVPNELLLSQPVQNFSQSDKRGNVTTRIRIAYDSDVDRAMTIMADAAKAHSRVLDDPAVAVMLSDFGADGIELELSFWVPDPENGTGVTRSDINRAIWDEFKTAGIAVPYPQRDVRVSLQHDDGAGRTSISTAGEQDSTAKSTSAPAIPPELRPGATDGA
jgi:small-conductance mechanosensitive channel